MDVTLLQTRLGHHFANSALLQQALTHRSHSVDHNERLEFLGDSILNCAIASLLYQRFGSVDEGDLSRVRANLVKQQSLYEIAQRIELSQFLRLGEGELKSGGFRRPSILADALEALFGAIFLDAGFDAAYQVIGALYDPVLQTVDPATLGKDAKTLLQELLQGKKIPLPQYTVVGTRGAAHNQEFEVECQVPKLNIQVFGAGGSRRGAEQAAALLALDAIKAVSVKGGPVQKRTRTRNTQLKLAGIATEQEPQASTRSSPGKTRSRTHAAQASGPVPARSAAVVPVVPAAAPAEVPATAITKPVTHRGPAVAKTTAADAVESHEPINVAPSNNKNNND